MKNYYGIWHWNSPGFINVKNGVYDVFTGKLLKHSSEFNFNYFLDVDFDFFAKCPKFEKFLYEFSNYDLERLQTIRDMLGYIFIIGEKNHFVFNLVGNGYRNGRSVLAYVLRSFFENNYSSGVMIQELKNKNGRYRLEKSLLNFVPGSPIEFVDKKSCEYISKIINHEQIDNFNFPVQASLVFCFDMKRPQYADTSSEFQDKLIFINCEFKLTRDNTNLSLRNELNEEKSGILNYMIECSRELIANGCVIRTCKDQKEKK